MALAPSSVFLEIWMLRRMYQCVIINDIAETGANLVGRTRKLVLMHNSAPAHAANSMTQFLRERNAPGLDWVGNSPDANPIENVWSTFGRRSRLSTSRTAMGSSTL